MSIVGCFLFFYLFSCFFLSAPRDTLSVEFKLNKEIADARRVVSFSDFRDSETYIIGKEGKLIRNPDYSNSGYLSIPYEITQYLDDAKNKYSKGDIEFSSIF